VVVNVEQSFVEGILLKEIFRNKDNDFAICSILLISHNATEEILHSATKPVYESDIPPGFNVDDYGAITISGYFPMLDDSLTYKFIGKWIQHSRYGWQFQVASFSRKQVITQSNSSIITYLSSDVFKGVGKKTAEAVVDKLGSEAISLILKDESLLKGIRGVSLKQQETIIKTLRERQGDELILGPLYSYGISPKFVVKILKIYEKNALSIIQNNPYQLIIDIEGIGFLKADEIAKSMGIEYNDPRRIKAALVHVINRICHSDGHTYITENQLLEASLQFINADTRVEESLIYNMLEQLIEEQQLSKIQNKLFLPTLMQAEINIAAKIKMLQKADTISVDEIEKAFESVKEKLDIEYSKKQEEAILKSLGAQVSIITGGPGTGKTTVVNGILKVYDKIFDKVKKPKKIRLASPTGRAAKRVEETTGRDASTLHRLLEYSRDGTFGIHADEPLTADLIIIDEVSMLDTYLANQLFSSLNQGTQIILVGDDNQLPSVGPGQVLKDLIESENIPITRLTEIHRQAKGSSVITLAHAINHGILPEDLLEKKSDRLFVQSHSDDILRLLKQVTTGAIAKGYTAKEVQVLIPMYRGGLGIDAVNLSLQELFNPESKTSMQIQIGPKIFREGDKVLQLINNPDAGVMNGDVGEIVRVIDKGNKSEVLVDFDGEEVAYSKDEMMALTHAYAMSIHKSQGSEYPVVIMPITKAYWIMLQRKLIYTGLTRASKSLILIGDYEALEFAAKNPGAIRQTMLIDRMIGQPVDDKQAEKIEDIKSVNDEKLKQAEHMQKQPILNIHELYFKTHEIPFAFLDEIKIKDITPYYFMNN